MTERQKATRSATVDQAITRPIGAHKAAKFSEVEGLKMSQAAKALSHELISKGLTGDAYRVEVAKAFKKG